MLFALQRPLTALLSAGAYLCAARQEGAVVVRQDGASARVGDGDLAADHSRTGNLPLEEAGADVKSLQEGAFSGACSQEVRGAGHGCLEVSVAVCGV